MTERAFDLSFGPDGPVSATLAADAFSFTYDAGIREVRAQPDGSLLGDDPFTVLDGLLDGDPDTLWVGWFGYAANPDLPARPAGHGVPDAAWMRTRLSDCVRRRPSFAPPGPVRSRSPHEPPTWYLDAYDEVQRRLRAGDSYEVNLTLRREIDAQADPADVYERLRGAVGVAPYAGLVRHGDAWLLSASPETYAT